MQREGFELDYDLTANINYLKDHYSGEQRIPIKSRLRYMMTTFTKTRFRWIFIAKITKEFILYMHSFKTISILSFI